MSWFQAEHSASTMVSYPASTLWLRWRSRRESHTRSTGFSSGLAGRQADQRHVVRDVECMGDLPSPLIGNHDGALAGGQRLAEPVQEHLHGGRGHFGQHERKALAGRRLHGCEQVRPGAALVTQARRTLAAGEPAVAHTPFLAEPVNGLRPSTVLEPERQALAGMFCCGPVQGGEVA